MIPVVHDVLQNKNFSRLQQKSIKEYGDFFTQFKKFIEPIKDREMILLICAKGIKSDPKWVEFIKKLPKARVELHCWEHTTYTKMSQKLVREQLVKAKALIEETFETKVTTFFPPKNKYNDMTREVCDELGLSQRESFMSPGRFFRKKKRKWVDFHYWNKIDRTLMRRYALYPEIQDPFFIIGAPRSGTTALLRWYGKNHPNAITCKEIESIWRKGGEPMEYYASRLRKEGKDLVIDKNARNSVRLKRISKMFPDARWIQIIRDGRASALSWQRHAIRTDKYDQTLQYSAKQWVHFVLFIRNYSKHLSRYKEVRYEDLCEEYEFFNNRNYKYQEELGPKRIKIIEDIQGELLEELGYIGGDYDPNV